jgi:hypothetical protein
MAIEAGAALTLDAAKSRATEKINADCAALRTRFLTEIAFQGQTYRDKLDDCRAYLAADNPDLDNYPWLAGADETERMGAHDAAEYIVQTYQTWRAIGVAIERVRITTKRLVEAATSQPDVAQELYYGRAALAGEASPRVPASVTTTLDNAVHGASAETIT